MRARRAYRGILRRFFCRSGWLRQGRFEVLSWSFEENWEVVCRMRSQPLQQKQNVDFGYFGWQSPHSSIRKNANQIGRSSDPSGLHRNDLQLLTAKRFRLLAT